MPGVWVLIVMLSGHAFIGDGLYDNQAGCETVRAAVKSDESKCVLFDELMDAKKKAERPRHP